MARIWPLRVDGGADFVMLLARMIGRDQVFAPVLDPFDRTTEFQRGGANQNILWINFAADAEAAADMALVRAGRIPVCAQAFAPAYRGSSAALWRRRAFPKRRAPRRNGRWRRASPAARPNGGRSITQAKQRHARRGRRRRRRHTIFAGLPLRWSVHARRRPVARWRATLLGVVRPTTSTKSAASSARYAFSAKTTATGSPT